MLDGPIVSLSDTFAFFSLLYRNTGAKMLDYVLLFFLLCLTSTAIRIPAIFQTTDSVQLRPRSERSIIVRSDGIPPIVAAGGETYSVNSSESPTTQNVLGTYLYGFDGCTSAEKANNPVHVQKPVLTLFCYRIRSSLHITMHGQCRVLTV